MKINMLNSKEKFGDSLHKAKNIALLSAPLVGSLLIPTSVYAAESDSGVGTVTDSITSALSASKGDFLTAIGGVVAVAVGFFVVKYIIVQVISFFKKVASK